MSQLGLVSIEAGTAGAASQLTIEPQRRIGGRLARRIAALKHSHFPELFGGLVAISGGD